MRLVTGFAFALATATLASVCAAQSLGEVARQERAKKKAPYATRRVITEEQLPAAKSKDVADGLAKSSEAKETKETTTAAETARDEKQAAAELQAKIKAQKQKVRELEAKIQEAEKKLSARDTLRNLSVYQQVIGADWWSGVGACDMSNAMHSNPYKEWCEEPAKLNAELEKNRPELEKEKAALEALQEQARRQGYGSAFRQGYGSAFYDPD